MKVAGVDAALGGWIAVLADADGFVDAALFSDFSAVADALEDADVIGVDVPIGLPVEGVRRADVEARRVVGARRSSVFAAPVRAAFDEDSYAAARTRYRGISAQAWALKRAIVDVERYADDPRVHEVHPEVSFSALNGGEVAFGKRSWNGMQHRLELLRAAGIAIPAALGEAGLAAVDDVLDAAAVAWTARRISAGAARTLPADPAPGEPTISY